VYRAGCELCQARELARTPTVILKRGVWRRLSEIWGADKTARMTALAQSEKALDGAPS
jgi:hypothetical protein